MIKKSIALVIMITSLPVGLLVWFVIYKHYQYDEPKFNMIVEWGFRSSLILVFLSKILSELFKKKNKNNESIYFNMYDIVELIVIYIGIALFIGKIIKYLIV